ncbi:DUF2851 family protein, partial [bacterium]|nr:DUF2851 family protein [bacterium]
QVVPFVQRLENLWAEFQSKHGTVPMKRNEWKLFRMRPDNFPTIRIAGFSMFLVQHRHEELLPFFMSRIERTTPATFEDCASPLTVRSFGHWSEHYLLEDGGRRQLSDLIGRQRAFEIMVNAVLPVAALYARKKGLEDVHQNILHLYQTAASFEENSIVNYMKKQIKKAAKGKRSIQYVQGLIQLYKRCTEYNCADCPVFEKSMEGKN